MSLNTCGEYSLNVKNYIKCDLISTSRMDKL